MTDFTKPSPVIVVVEGKQMKIDRYLMVTCIESSIALASEMWHTSRSPRERNQCYRDIETLRKLADHLTP